MILIGVFNFFLSFFYAFLKGTNTHESNVAPSSMWKNKKKHFESFRNKYLQQNEYSRLYLDTFWKEFFSTNSSGSKKHKKPQNKTEK